jgi:hypothetical protein
MGIPMGRTSAFSIFAARSNLESPRCATATVRWSVTRKRIKIAEKLKALELLGKHLGLFDQKVTINGGDPLTLLIQSIQGLSFQPIVLTKIDACNTK